MKQEPFVLERSFLAPADQLWQALTDKDKMKQWYFDLEKFIPEVGFEFQFYGEKDEKKYLHLCKITEVIPGEKLAYTWRYKDYPGESVVSFELFPEGDTTRLKLTHQGLDSFPAGNPDFAKESFEAGWNYIIGTSLKNFVENSLQKS
ncbi:MAG: SRPBCC domain-containing protein [Ferruginibacter sp.]